MTVSWSQVLEWHTSRIEYLSFIENKGKVMLVSSDKNRFMALTNPHTGECKTKILLPDHLLGMRTVGNSLRCIMGSNPMPIEFKIEVLEI